ncbi:MFS transporter [Vacuolonema iberomarrocanum]|uniref:MFS transporter n=1 Tax=Vacuolonema iberomarrocanum TaxID=3454632 RepID=UPI003F6DB5EC
MYRSEKELASHPSEIEMGNGAEPIQTDKSEQAEVPNLSESNGHGVKSQPSNLTGIASQPSGQTADVGDSHERPNPATSHGRHAHLDPDDDLECDRPTAPSDPPPTLNAPNPSSDKGFLPVLKNGNFLSLWSGQVFSQLADKVYLVLMIMIITSQFQSAEQTVSGWVSAVMVAFTIPAVLFGSVAGVFVDYWQKKQVLVLTNLLRGGLVLSLPLLLGLVQQDWAIASMPIGFAVLLGITFLVSTLTQFFAPAEQAVIPLVVPKQHLLSANSLYTTTMMASVIIGFAIGEPLLAFADRVIAPYVGVADLGKELLVGSSYALAGVILLGVQTQETGGHLTAADRSPTVWQDIRDGLRYLKQNRDVRAALIQLIVLFSIFAALAVLAVRLAEIMPNIRSSQFGFLLAAGGVGMGLGALSIGQLGHLVSRDRLSLFGSIGFGLSLAALSLFTQQLLPTLLILVTLGACAALVGVPLQTTIQEQTPEAMRGKVFGLQNNAVNIALSLPLALAGVAEATLGLQVVLLILGFTAIASGLFTQRLTNRDG